MVGLKTCTKSLTDRIDRRISQLQITDDFFILLDSNLIQDKLFKIFNVPVAKYGISNKRDLETVALLYYIV